VSRSREKRLSYNNPKDVYHTVGVSQKHRYACIILCNGTRIGEQLAHARGINAVHLYTREHHGKTGLRSREVSLEISFGCGRPANQGIDRR
jgi:hypothetical protein